MNYFYWFERITDTDGSSLESLPRREVLRLGTINVARTAIILPIANTEQPL